MKIIPNNRKKIIKELDKQFSIFIRNRDRKCIQCGKRTGLTCGHLLTRTAYSTRWDELNCHCQCAGCNWTHEHKPDRFTRWFLDHYGTKKYITLCEKHNRIRKFTTDELQKMVIYYKGLNENGTI